METTTSFDLNRAIQQWRESLQQSPAFRRENLDELETHLRDSVAALQGRGLSEAEAFLVAIRRAGSGAILGAEFGKVNARSIWLDRVLWMLVGNLFFWFVGGLLSLIGSGLLFVGFKEFGAAGSNSSSYLYVAVFSTVIQLLTFAGALVLCWRLFTSNWGPATKWLAKNSRSSARLAAVAVIGIIGMMLARLVEGFSSALLFEYASPTDVARFATGRSLGGMIASLIQTAVFVILALWLARRRLLAKT
jgi:hypothetical protein